MLLNCSPVSPKLHMEFWFQIYYGMSWWLCFYVLFFDQRHGTYRKVDCTSEGSRQVPYGWCSLLDVSQWNHWCRHTGFPSRLFQTSWPSHWIFCQARQIMSPLDFPVASSESSGSWYDHEYCYMYTKWQSNSVDGLVSRPALNSLPRTDTYIPSINHLPSQNPFQLNFKNVINLQFNNVQGKVIICHLYQFI